ncbi:MAG: hypothetical protein R2838_09325 [Caldilineaceae bacterium]
MLIVIGGGKRPKGSRRKQYDPRVISVSAVLNDDGCWSLPLPILDLLAWLWQRWELEAAHIVEKWPGASEKQCWNEKATVNGAMVGLGLYAHDARRVLRLGQRLWRQATWSMAGSTSNDGPSIRSGVHSVVNCGSSLISGPFGPVTRQLA